MTREQTVIQAVEAFAAANGISPATVTSRAVQNSRLYSRLKKGGACTQAVADRIASYIGQSQPAGASA